MSTRKHGKEVKLSFIILLTVPDWPIKSESCFDCSLERERWAHLARSGLLDLIPRKKKNDLKRTYKVSISWKTSAIRKAEAEKQSK